VVVEHVLTMSPSSAAALVAGTNLSPTSPGYTAETGNPDVVGAVFVDVANRRDGKFAADLKFVNRPA